MPDPFDPIKGAWWLLLVFVLTLAANSVMLFMGCAWMGVAAVCDKGEGLKQLGLEMLTAIAVLIAAGKRG